MSSSMNNFMEAYRAVHSPEAKEEFYAKRDSITEMNLTSLFHTDLVDITEQVVSKLFETLTVNQTKELVVETFCEVPSVQEEKVDRILEAFKTVFRKVDEVAATVAREQFSQYLKHKRLDRQKAVMNSIEESQQRFHRHAVAGDVENVKNLLLTMLEKKLDAVGQEDADIDNDGDVDSSDKYLHKRRKAIGKAMGKKDKKDVKKEEVEQVDENRAAMGRINKEYHRKKESEAMAARSRDPKVKRDLPKRKNDNPMYDPKSAGSSRVKGFKFTGEDVKEARNPGESPMAYKKRMEKKYKGAKISKDYDPMKDPNFDHDKAERTRGSMEEGYGMHRDAKTGKVVDKAEVGKTYYPNQAKKKTSVTKKPDAFGGRFSKEEIDRINKIVETWEE